MTCSLRLVLVFKRFEYLNKSTITLTPRQLRNTDRNGTWCRKRCRLEGIIKYVSDGFASSAYLIVSPTYPRFRLGASASHQARILLLMVVHHPDLLLGLGVAWVEVGIRCYYLSRSWGWHRLVASWLFRGGDIFILFLIHTVPERCVGRFVLFRAHCF